MKHLLIGLLVVFAFTVVACCPGCGNCGDGTCAPASEEPASEEVEKPTEDVENEVETPEGEPEAAIQHINGCVCCTTA